jgi:hypothetical protein
LPRIGDSGIRAIPEQLDDKFAHRSPAADQHSKLQLAVHNDATLNVDDAIDHDAAFHFDHQPVYSRGKFDDEPVCPRRVAQPLAGARQYSGGTTWWNDALSGADQQPGSREQPGPADPE